MNVALWAEIRRLAEIEKLSGRAIAQRLHCSRHTVAAALELRSRRPAHAAQRPVCWILTGSRSTICWPNIPISRPCASARRSPRTQGYAGSTGILRRYLRQRPSGTRPRLPGGALRTGPGDAGRLGRMRPRTGRLHHSQGLGVRGRALL